MKSIFDECRETAKKIVKVNINKALSRIAL